MLEKQEKHRNPGEQECVQRTFGDGLWFSIFKPFFLKFRHLFLAFFLLYEIEKTMENLIKTICSRNIRVPLCEKGKKLEG